MEPTVVSLASAMFHAYNERGGWKTFDGRPVPKWEELGDEVRDRWIAAAQVAQDKIDRLMIRVEQLAADRPGPPPPAGECRCSGGFTCTPCLELAEAEDIVHPTIGEVVVYGYQDPDDHDGDLTAIAAIIVAVNGMRAELQLLPPQRLALRVPASAEVGAAGRLTAGRWSR